MIFWYKSCQPISKWDIHIKCILNQNIRLSGVSQKESRILVYITSAYRKYLRYNKTL